MRYPLMFCVAAFGKRLLMFLSLQNVPTFAFSRSVAHNVRKQKQPASQPVAYWVIISLLHFITPPLHPLNSHQTHRCCPVAGKALRAKRSYAEPVGLACGKARYRTVAATVIHTAFPFGASQRIGTELYGVCLSVVHSTPF